MADLPLLRNCRQSEVGPLLDDDVWWLQSCVGKLTKLLNLWSPTPDSFSSSAHIWATRDGSLKETGKMPYNPGGLAVSTTLRRSFPLMSPHRSGAVSRPSTRFATSGGRRKAGLLRRGAEGVS